MKPTQLLTCPECGSATISMWPGQHKCSECYSLIDVNDSGEIISEVPTVEQIQSASLKFWSKPSPNFEKRIIHRGEAVSDEEASIIGLDDVDLPVVEKRDPTKLYCSYCNKVVNRTEATFGKKPVVRFINQIVSLDPYIEERKVVHSTINLVACPDDSLKIGMIEQVEKIRDEFGEVVEERTTYKNITTFPEMRG